MTDRHCYEWPRPALTADVLVFDDEGEAPSILLIRRKSEPFAASWALPGGFMDEGETLEGCARRELAEETGLAAGELRLIGVYSTPGRDPRGWTVSAAFWTAEDRSTGGAVAGDDAADVRWFALDDLPVLAFDHAQIIADARRAAGF